MRNWRVGITRDILDSRGEPAFGRKALAHPRRRASTSTWEYLPEVVPAITPDTAARYDALYVNTAARARGSGRARRLPAARRRAARRRLRLGRRAGDDRARASS